MGRFYCLRILTVVAVSLFVSGCGGGRWIWQHPDGLGNAALQQAKSECRALAENEIDNFSDYLPYYAPFPFKRNYHSGHLRPAYRHQPYYDFHHYNINLQQLFRFCMQAKGWGRVAIERLPQQSPQ